MVVDEVVWVGDKLITFYLQWFMFFRPGEKIFCLLSYHSSHFSHSRMPDSQENIKAFWDIEALHDIEADKLHFLLGMRKQNGKKKK